MHPQVIHNRELIEAAKARVPAITGASLHGRGVFTTLAVHTRRAFLWAEHWARLAEHARRLSVGLGAWDELTVKFLLAQLIEANNVEEGRARVTLLARVAGGVWETHEGGGDGLESDLLIITGDARRTPTEGLALTVSPHRLNALSPLAGLKSVNYLEHMLAWEEARAREFDEAVMTNERGDVVSATTANLFWLAGGTLYTPALQTGALAGVTRAGVLQLAVDLNVPAVEGVFDLAHLGDAEEIFLTSSARGIALVNTFDFRRYAVHAGSVAVRLREAYRQLTLEAGA